MRASAMRAWGVGLGLALVTAGCAGTNRRVLTQPDRARPALVGDETEKDVERAWGPPDRRIEAVDEKTGRTRVVWQYDRYLDTNGSKVTTSVTFTDGRVARVDPLPVPRSPANDGLPRDSAAKRDME